VRHDVDGRACCSVGAPSPCQVVWRGPAFYICSDRMNLPNLLTILRIFFVPLLVALVVQGVSRWSCLGGRCERPPGACHIPGRGRDRSARRLPRPALGQITTVGTLLDPIADKLLISSALIALVQIRLVPPGW